jgi:hypothetical protein
MGDSSIPNELRIDVTKKHILYSDLQEAERCMVAKAVIEEFGFKSVSVGGVDGVTEGLYGGTTPPPGGAWRIHLTFPGLKHAIYKIPVHIGKRIEAWDRIANDTPDADAQMAAKEKFKPFSFVAKRNSEEERKFVRNEYAQEGGEVKKKDRWGGVYFDHYKRLTHAQVQAHIA